MSTTYTADEIDEKLATTMNNITNKLDKVIVMANPGSEISPVETSLYMQVVSKEERG
jgi:hypothetical protein